MGPLHIVFWVFYGAVVGCLARWIYPGPQRMGLAGTIVLGVVGSFLGGATEYLLGHDNTVFQPSGIIMSVASAAITIYVWTSKETIFEKMSSWFATIKSWFTKK